ncbi:YveK family protein [Clostridium sp.]|uniref:YveK family protein n=1 Tax=Clostridium sp. TaxID=1506 RepID=UPI003993E923
MNDEVIRLEDILYSLKMRWKMIVLITFIATIVAGIFSFFIIKPTYESKVKVFIGKEDSIGEAKDYSNNDVMMYQKLMKTYAEVIKTKDSVQKALETIEGNVSAERVSKVLSNITVLPSADTQILEITYKTKNRSEVTSVLKAITNTFITQSKELIPNGNIQIIQKAEEPKNPVAPNKMMNIGIGFLLGLMISIGIAFLQEYLDNTFKKSDELEEVLALPILGVIPDFNSKKKDKYKKRGRN